MDIEQMTLEQQHEPGLKDLQLKCQKLEQTCEDLFKVRDEWADLANERLYKINDLLKQLNEQKTHIEKLTETIVELDIKFKAVHSISRVASSYLTHAQRKVLAQVQEDILTGGVKKDKTNSPLYDNF